MRAKKDELHTLLKDIERTAHRALPRCEHDATAGTNYNYALLILWCIAAISRIVHSVRMNAYPTNKNVALIKDDPDTGNVACDALKCITRIDTAAAVMPYP